MQKDRNNEIEAKLNRYFPENIGLPHN